MATCRYQRRWQAGSDRWATWQWSCGAAQYHRTGARPASPRHNFTGGTASLRRWSRPTETATDGPTWSRRISPARADQPPRRRAPERQLAAGQTFRHRLFSLAWRTNGDNRPDVVSLGQLTNRHGPSQHQYHVALSGGPATGAIDSRRPFVDGFGPLRPMRGGGADRDRGARVRRWSLAIGASRAKAMRQAWTWCWAGGGQSPPAPPRGPTSVCPPAPWAAARCRSHRALGCRPRVSNSCPRHRRVQGHDSAAVPVTRPIAAMTDRLVVAGPTASTPDALRNRTCSDRLRRLKDLTWLGAACWTMPPPAMVA